MTAKVGFPTLRLIRTNIEDLDLGNMKPGDCKQIEKKMILRKLKI
jgi:16S rRNA U516 pseudouridylate synthase RsuA-like enzyme